MRRVLLNTILALALAGGAVARPRAPPADLAALRAQALLATLNAELLSHPSATATLQAWCDARGLAPGARIVAQRREEDGDPAPTAEVRAALGAGPDEPLAWRGVALSCGDHVLSVADNWYRPGRLTAEMNRRLAETQTPFGVVVADLHFTRRTLSATVLYHPLPEGWVRPGATLAGGQRRIPPIVLTHRAVLSDAGGVPFSLVTENYTAETLAEPGTPRR